MAGRVLLVASTGGHLEELFQLRPSLVGADDDVAWVTFDSPQSRSLLASESDVTFMRRVGSRGYVDLLRSIVPAARVLLRVRPRAVYSTGAAIALAFLPFAWLVHARGYYIESAARSTGPSATGRILSMLPWIRLRTQYRHWANARWGFAGSVFDGYVPSSAPEPPVIIRRVVVTLGTQEGYPFVSLVERMIRIVPDGVDIRWQLGPDFPHSARPPEAREVLSQAELHEWIESADVVVAHAGVGSALTMLNHGRAPVLVPRSAERGEHVDDHQLLIARDLTARGLAVSAGPEELTWAHLVRSTETVAVRVDVALPAPAGDIVGSAPSANAAA